MKSFSPVRSVVPSRLALFVSALALSGGIVFLAGCATPTAEIGVAPVLVAPASASPSGGASGPVLKAAPSTAPNSKPSPALTTVAPPTLAALDPRELEPLDPSELEPKAPLDPRELEPLDPSELEPRPAR